MATRKTAVIFGGRTVEHEVSVITAHQLMDAIVAAGFEVLPIYVTKDGEWRTAPELFDMAVYRDRGALERVLGRARPVVVRPGKTRGGLFAEGGGILGMRRLTELPVEVVFPAIHGSFGEDGALQGVLEWANLPYAGSDVRASAVGMDKVLAKRLLESSGVPVLPSRVWDRSFFERPEEELAGGIEALGGLPVMVKPTSLGSSIGVALCPSLEEVREALELALELDSRALVEPALEDFYEINCAVLGPPARASVCEMPRAEEGFLSYDQKYMRGGKGGKGGGGAKSEGMASLDRILPAPIPESESEEIRRLAVEAFELFGASGVARIDFLVDRADGKVYFNEINTIPGSFSFYLWEESGLPFDRLVEELIEIARARQRERETTTFAFETPLLAG